MKKKEKDKLLNPNSKVSSMRWALITMTPVVKWLLISAPIILMIQSFLPLHKTDWMGVAAYIGAIGVFYTGLLFGKAYQKSNEIK